MKTLQILVLLAFIIVGLVNRRHLKPKHEVPPRTSAVTAAVPTAVHKEILQNAERLAETLRRCQQTADKSKPIH